MTIIKGQIESLKRIKSELNQRGITRFSSIGEINVFLQNYTTEKNNILDVTRKELEKEIAVLEADRIFQEKNYNELKARETKKLDQKIAELTEKNLRIQSKNVNVLVKALSSVWLEILHFRIIRLKKNFDKIIVQQTKEAAESLQRTTQKLNDYQTNMEGVIVERSSSTLRELEFTKEVVDSLNPLIAGAVGESLVADEVKKLSDEHILFNDFSMGFDPPIYNRRDNDRIYSIQIDHLIVNSSGVFLIETKNWSKESIKNLDMRSPVDQIKRAGYAVFVLLNSEKSSIKMKLKGHHWGEKKIPVKNVIVMINHKPKEQFKHVVVKTLNQLNQYLTCHDPIFDAGEVSAISDHLDLMRSKGQVNKPYGQKAQQMNSKSLSFKNINSTNISNRPPLHEWRKMNPGKTLNDYYSKFGGSHHLKK